MSSLPQLPTAFKRPTVFWGVVLSLGAASLLASPTLFPEPSESRRMMDREVQRVRLQLGLTPLPDVPLPEAESVSTPPSSS
ncbi:hypothetical protein H9P43_003899 [Blastocladiella emersonii ATCC 22665]|nr:hypothetical protein H9P43_003899 [Blastocladiella emersonii ATCC 22665]